MARHNVGGVLVILRATVPGDPAPFTDAAHRALAALSTRPGYVAGHVGRAVDDPERWVVSCQWSDVGSGRRGLTSGDVRAEIMPLMALVEAEPNAYEIVPAPSGGPTGPAVRQAAPGG